MRERTARYAGRLPALLISLCFYLCPQPAAMACLWDYDTLQQERARFPTALELITGRFLRHSKEFYEWRIRDRLKKIADDPSHVEYYDDLGVAYQKIGQHGKAVQTMLLKEKLRPGLYETESNLGTFYVLSGELAEGLKHIDKALQINPHAHFDRERYQKWLVEYAISHRKGHEIGFPLGESSGWERHTFSEFLAGRLQITGRLPLSEMQKAVQAVLGMMRFADYDNPLLLEALGDLLSQGDRREDAKRLAARSYLAASFKFKGKPEELDYMRLAALALRGQTVKASSSERLVLSDLEADFRKECAASDSWYANLRALEHTWICKGLNVDAEFDSLYTTEPRAFDKDEVPFFGLIALDSEEVVLGLTLLCAVWCLGLISFRAIRRRNVRQSALEKLDMADKVSPVNSG